MHGRVQIERCEPSQAAFGEFTAAPPNQAPSAHPFESVCHALGVHEFGWSAHQTQCPQGLDVALFL